MVIFHSYVKLPEGKTHEEIKIHKELLFLRSEGNQGSDP